MVSAAANGSWWSRPSALVTRWQGWPSGRRSPGRWGSALALRSVVLAETRRKALGAAPRGDRRHPGPSPCAFGMLQNPVTSTPFSVKDILRPEREQIGLEALQVQGARRSQESSEHLRQVPEPQGSVVRHTGRGGSDKRKDMSEPPGGSCETVTEVVTERMGEPREYKLRSWLLRRDHGGGGQHSLALRGAGTHPVFSVPRAYPNFLLFEESKRQTQTPLPPPPPKPPLCFTSLEENKVLNLRASLFAQQPVLIRPQTH